MDSKTIENINPSTTATQTTTVEQVQSSPHQTQMPTPTVNTVMTPPPIPTNEASD